MLKKKKKTNNNILVPGKYGCLITMISLWQVTVVKIIVINDLIVFFAHVSQNVRVLFFHTKEESLKNSYSLCSKSGGNNFITSFEAGHLAKTLGLHVKVKRTCCALRSYSENLPRFVKYGAFTLHYCIRKGNSVAQNVQQCQGCGKNSLCRLALSSFILHYNQVIIGS